MTRFDPKAIAIATFASLALELVGEEILLVLFSTGLEPTLSPEQLTAAAEAVMREPGFQFAALLYGIFTTAMGGYIAARLAKRYPYFNALAVGLVCIVLALALSTEISGWFDAIAYASTLPAAVFGGHLLARQRRNQ